MKGVQKLLRSRDAAEDGPVTVPPSAMTVLPPSIDTETPQTPERGSIDIDRLLALRARLAAALEG